MPEDSPAVKVSDISLYVESGFVDPYLVASRVSLGGCPISATLKILSFEYCPSTSAKQPSVNMPLAGLASDKSSFT